MRHLKKELWRICWITFDPEDELRVICSRICNLFTPQTIKKNIDKTIARLMSSFNTWNWQTDVEGRFSSKRPWRPLPQISSAQMKWGVCILCRSEVLFSQNAWHHFQQSPQTVQLLCKIQLSFFVSVSRFRTHKKLDGHLFSLSTLSDPVKKMQNTPVWQWRLALCYREMILSREEWLFVLQEGRSDSEMKSQKEDLERERLHRCIKPCMQNTCAFILNWVQKAPS